jgi:hypothetical protein
MRFDFGPATPLAGSCTVIERDGAGEVAEALGDVIGGAEYAIGAGQNQALDSSRASRARVWGGAGDVIGRADDAIGSGAKQWLGPRSGRLRRWRRC